MKSTFGRLYRAILGITVLVWLAFGTTLSAGEARSLDVAAESVAKKEIRYSMLGPRDTLIFYTFDDQQAVLLVKVDNKTLKFPVRATVYFFTKDTDAEALGKWVNNQHSDGLYSDAPKPTGKFEVPAESCETVSHKKLNRKDGYDNYAVEYRIDDVKQGGVLELKGFAATTQVLVKVP